MIRILNFILICAVSVFSAFATGQENKSPVYLSYEQRVLVAYALHAQGETPENKKKIFGRLMDLGAKTLALGTQTVAVSNFGEFLSHYRGEWPNTNSLELDLSIIESRAPRGQQIYRASSPRIQNQIDRFIKEQNKRLLEMTMRSGANNALFPSLLDELKGQSEREIIARAIDLSDRLIAIQIEELNHIGEKIAESKMASQQDPATKIALQTIFSEYFGGLSSASKKLIISSYLGSDLSVTELEKFELMIQNSGPQLQKLLQVLARQPDMDPEMIKIFKKLESAVREVPWVQVKEIVANERANFDFVAFERKPLGIGSMAQVHRAKIMVNGKRTDVIARFLKPGIATRVLEDHKILTRIATILDANPILESLQIPKMLPMVADITRTVQEELSQEETIERQLQAKKAYERTVGFKTAEYKSDLKVHVPAVYLGKSKSQLMVQEMVLGQPLDQAFASHASALPTVKKALTEEMSKIWLNEVLFGSGFYHADLHQGNFLVRVAEPTIQLTLLDFGMSGTLSRQLQADVVLLGLGLEVLDERLIADAFLRISDRSKNRVSDSAFREKVAAEVARARVLKGPQLPMEIWVAWAMEAGIHPSYEFVSLNRGTAILGQMLLESGSLETIASLTKKLAATHPLLIYQLLTREGRLTNKILFELGIKYLKKPASKQTAPTSLFPSRPKPIVRIRCESIF